ncbi:MAG: ABC transporter substrate-binding protein, partial [Candidatus Thorarchaeota archaeon]
MSMHQRFQIITIVILSTIILSSFTVSPTSIDYSATSSNNIVVSQDITQQIFHGGTIETIRIVEYNSLVEALDALEAGDADVFGHRINETDYDIVQTYSNIEEQWAFDSTTCLVAINTDIYPLENDHVRRAIAYAIDKLDISENAMDVQVDVVDFALPLYNEYSIEEQYSGLFYDSDTINATLELELAGMLDVDDDTMVEAPNGDEMLLSLWYPLDISGMNETAAEISENLLSVGLNHTLVAMNYTDLQYEVANHNSSYNLALYHQELSRYGFDWAATNFHSTKQSEFGNNVANVYEGTLNELSLDYNTAMTLEAAEEIGHDALLALRNLAPIIPLFNYRWLSVYTEANLDGWINDTSGGAIDLWNPVSVTPKSGADSEMV